MHVANNAARDTARFAVVHTNGGTTAGEPTTITKSDLIAAVYSGQIGSITIEGSGLAGMDRNSLENFTVVVFIVDPAGLSLSPPVIQAAFPDSIWSDCILQPAYRRSHFWKLSPRCCQSRFSSLNSTVPIQVTVLSSSEAN